MEKPFIRNNLRVETHTSDYGRSPVGYGGGISAFVKRTAKYSIQPKKPKGFGRNRQWLRKRTMNLGTWNIQGIRTKEVEVFREIEKSNLDITILTETKKKGTGEEYKHNFLHIWSGVEKSIRAKRGVSIVVKKELVKYVKNWQPINERIMTITIKMYDTEFYIVAVYGPNEDATIMEKDEFYECLEETIGKAKKDQELVIVGDLNGRIRGKQADRVVGRYGDDDENDNGERILQLCYQQDLTILNSRFKHKKIHTYTWEQRTRNLRSILDLIIMKQQRSCIVKDVRAYRGPECGTDHKMVKAEIICPKKRKTYQVKAEKEEQKIESHEFKIHLLQEESIQALYEKRINKYIRIYEDSTVENKYKHLKEVIIKAASEALGTEKPNKRNSPNMLRLEENLENLIVEKKQAHQKYLSTNQQEDKETYNTLKREVKKQIKKEKNRQWDQKCIEIENTIGYKRSAEAWKFIRKMRQNQAPRSLTKFITMDSWKKYYEKLLQEDRQEYQNIEEEKIDNDEEPVKIEEEEVEEAVRTSKNGKSSGPGMIKIELIKYGGKNVITLLTDMFNQILEGEQPPQEWRSAYICSIYKKGDKAKCENYRGLSVINSIGRIFSKVLKNKIERIIKPQISKDQAGFTAGKSGIDNIFCLQQIIEKYKSKNREVHLVFVDLEKAYDTVPRKLLWEAMKDMNIPQQLTNCVRRLYTDNKAQIKIGNTVSKSFLTTKGLKQGCGLSPTLFKIYMEKALNNWNRKCRGMGIEIGRQNMHSLLFADDQVVITQDIEDAQYMTRKLIEEFNKWGLKMNLQKTQYMNIGGPPVELDLENNTRIGNCLKFKYLGTTLDSSGNCNTDIKTKVGQAKKAIGCINGILWSRDVSINTKKKLYSAIVESILTYGCETWTLNQKRKQMLLSTEMDFWRRSSRTSRIQRVRNEEIRNTVGVQQTVVERVENKILKWYGHVLRMTEEQWPRSVMNWSPAGRRRRGRPELKWRTELRKVMRHKNLTSIDAEDRKLWRMHTSNR